MARWMLDTTAPAAGVSWVLLAWITPELTIEDRVLERSTIASDNSEKGAPAWAMSAVGEVVKVVTPARMEALRLTLMVFTVAPSSMKTP